MAGRAPGAVVAPMPTPDCDCAVVIALHDGCRGSREWGPSLLLPMSGIQEGGREREGGRATDEDAI